MKGTAASRRLSVESKSRKVCSTQSRQIKIAKCWKVGKTENGMSNLGRFCAYLKGFWPDSIKTSWRIDETEKVKPNDFCANNRI